MKLKRIELLGFKSFVDRTVLEFEEGITAILGPNGCGKSNVVDAVRWVLGEQSAKTLRGGKMDDVIFKGTVKRKPVGMAEVTLTFTNEDRGLPIEYDEVSIKRRVTRDGTSEYFLNGTLCRLKDLRDLFFDSGVNNTSYSIIEEAMIKQILNENNQELRYLLEEGSGITKYKARRKETQRRLDRTQQDLLRLNDIVEEIGREVRSLQRQVGKARRHQKLQSEIRGLDLILAARRRRQLDQQEQRARDRLQELKALAEVDTGELSGLRTQIDATRPQLDEREAERRQLEVALQAFEEELQEAERQVLVLEHRIDEFQRRGGDNSRAAEEAARRQTEISDKIKRMQEHLQQVVDELSRTGRLLDQRSESMQILDERVTTQRADLDEATQLNFAFIEDDAAQRSQLREFQVKRENRQERQATLAAERENLGREEAAAEATHAEASNSHEGLVGQRRQLLEGLAADERGATDLELQATDLQQEHGRLLARREAVHSRWELLAKIQAEYEGYGQGARSVLQRHGEDARVLGGLADRLQVPDDYTAGFELLLGELLDAVVVDGCETAVALVAELRQEEQGQASFLCGTAAPASDRDAVALPGGGRPALELVSGEVAALPHLQRVLATTFVFDDDDQAVAAALAHTGEPALYCVSRSGLLVTSDGVVRGGSGQAEASSLLGRGEKLEQLSKEIATCEKAVTAAEERLATVGEKREELRSRLAAGREQLAAQDEELGRLQLVLAQADSRRETVQRRREEIGNEEQRLAEELGELATAEEKLLDLLDESGRQRSDSTTRRDELRKVVEAVELERDEVRAEVEELRLIVQRREGDKRETETALAHLRDSVAELTARRERLAEEIEHGGEEMKALQAEYGERKEKLAGGFGERERRRQIVRAAADSIQELHEQTNGWHDRVKGIEDKRHGCKDQMHDIETSLATLDVKRNNLEERVEQEYHGGFEDLVASVEDDHLPRELEREGEVFQVDQASSLLEERRQKLASLGPINHLALEEYETKKERLDFLEAQRADVEKAKLDLERAIAEINGTARKLFADTFEEVRRNYVAVFQTLFKGGRADLRLIRTDDPLESSIHIVAQPTGKVIDSVALLSGGERCLTALSILFAVYLVKPSPFCLLDEADAPLDDSNIRRFVRMLREFSRNTQFLVITHNKLTMETANHLYGVTMMEQGCSSIVSVSFKDVAETQGDAELSNAIAWRRARIDRTESMREILADEDQEEVGMRFTIASDEDKDATAVEAEPEPEAQVVVADDEESAPADGAEPDVPAAEEERGSMEAQQ